MIVIAFIIIFVFSAVLLCHITILCQVYCIRIKVKTPYTTKYSCTVNAGVIISLISYVLHDDLQLFHHEFLDTPSFVYIFPTFWCRTIKYNGHASTSVTDLQPKTDGVERTDAHTLVPISSLPLPLPPLSRVKWPLSVEQHLQMSCSHVTTTTTATLTLPPLKGGAVGGWRWWWWWW